ncbi:CsbD family protein [Streptomonospora sp. PA3]|uniref:CsbD family protein n=1 Tax=Streptomonospora sp. PA3 TaxID=2607326 RepID=UPI0012DE5216|nr:CsbD family protein [Streptomonospora sp. PA3]MUL41721.1 CsbD family protein [Streptomonospora sp. PA3]
MSTGEKRESKVEQMRGKLKEAAGKFTGNERMKSQGRGEQTRGNVRETTEDAKDTARGFTEGLRGDSAGPAPEERRGGEGPDTGRR